MNPPQFERFSTCFPSIIQCYENANCGKKTSKSELPRDSLFFFRWLAGLNGLSFCSLQLHFLSKWSFDDDAIDQASAIWTASDGLLVWPQLASYCFGRAADLSYVHKATAVTIIRAKLNPTEDIGVDLDTKFIRYFRVISESSSSHY